MKDPERIGIVNLYCDEGNPFAARAQDVAHALCNAKGVDDATIYIGTPPDGFATYRCRVSVAGTAPEAVAIAAGDAVDQLIGRNAAFFRRGDHPALQRGQECATMQVRFEATTRFTLSTMEGDRRIVPEDKEDAFGCLEFGQ